MKKPKTKNIISVGLLISAFILTLALFLTFCLFSEDEEPFVIVGTGLAGLSTPLWMIFVSAIIQKDDEEKNTVRRNNTDLGLDLELLEKLKEKEYVYVLNIGYCELVTVDIKNEECEVAYQDNGNVKTDFVDFKWYGKTWALDRRDLE